MPDEELGLVVVLVKKIRIAIHFEIEKSENVKVLEVEVQGKSLVIYLHIVKVRLLDSHLHYPFEHAA